MSDQCLAPPGQIWVCAACGKTSKDRYRFRDSACGLHAVLCYEERDTAGLWVAVSEADVVGPAK